MRLGAVGAGAVVVSLGFASGAMAAPGGVRTAELTVSVEGVQTTTWEHHHFAEGGCDVPIDGSGAETYRFHSAKVRIRAYRSSSGIVLSGSTGEPLLRMVGTVTRAGVVAVGQGEACSSGDGTGTAPDPAPPDCGTRRIRTTVAVGFAARPGDLVVLAPDLDAPQDPFANCPTGASAQFPGLLTFDDADARIGQHLPAADLFGFGRNIVIARGTQTRSGGDATSTTSIRWTATFTRVSR